MQQVSREELIGAYESLKDGLDAIVDDLQNASRAAQSHDAKVFIERAMTRARKLTVALRCMAF